MLREQRIALKIAYDGTSFYGFQRQPDKKTVEGSLLAALTRLDAIRSVKECGYRSSSRTDRGVSALGNVVSFITSFDTRELCPALNSELEDIWAYSAVEVPENFNPRIAKERWYRYYLPKSGQDVALMAELAKRFVGTHDFSGYARKDRRSPVRRIVSIDVSDAGRFHALDFRAESFLWNMVRRIVWMIDAGSSGRVPLEAIGPDSPVRPRKIGLAPPEYLVLMDVDCGLEFPVDERAAAGARRALERRMRSAAMRLIFAQELCRLLGHSDGRSL